MRSLACREGQSWNSSHRRRGVLLVREKLAAVAENALLREIVLGGR
jgi:hypothetical protein